jgi:hypothetical protein
VDWLQATRLFRWVFKLPVLLALIGYGIYHFVDGLGKAHREYRLSDPYMIMFFVWLLLNRHTSRRRASTARGHVRQSSREL